MTELEQALAIYRTARSYARLTERKADQMAVETAEKDIHRLCKRLLEDALQGTFIPRVTLYPGAESVASTDA